MKKFLVLLFLPIVLVVIPGCQEVFQTEEQTANGFTVTGGKVEIVTGLEAGYSLLDFPQIGSITTAEYEKLSKANMLPGTGLFIQDGDYVPFNIDEMLKMYNVTLMSDGTLINKDGEPVLLFVQPETMKVIPDDAGARGNPYPFTYWTTSRANYRTSGFCREYIAYIHAYSWGTVDGVHVKTKIEYIYTLVGIGTKAEDSDSCYNCDHEYSKATVDLGCWWPTASGSGAQYFHMKDGNVTASKWYDFKI